jgi:hypothetical protein
MKVVERLKRKPSKAEVHVIETIEFLAFQRAAAKISLSTRLSSDLSQPDPGWCMCTPELVRASIDQRYKKHQNYNTASVTNSRSSL